MTRSRKGERQSPGPTAPPTQTARQCVWLTRGRRCLLLGSVLFGPEATPSRYCGWHVECLRHPELAEQFAPFQAWAIQLRALGYCGEWFDFSHTDPTWVYQLLIGDETAPLEPPGGRTGCAKSSCYYPGWNGPPVAQSTAGPMRHEAAGPSMPVPVGLALPAWVTEAPSHA